MREKILRFLNKIFFRKYDCQQCEGKKCVIYDGDELVKEVWTPTLLCLKCKKKFIVEKDKENGNKGN